MFLLKRGQRYEELTCITEPERSPIFSVSEAIKEFKKRLDKNMFNFDRYYVGTRSIVCVLWDGAEDFKLK